KDRQQDVRKSEQDSRENGEQADVESEQQDSGKIDFIEETSPWLNHDQEAHNQHSQHRSIEQMLDPRILRLVAITDDAEDRRSTLVDRVAAAVRGGATSVQVRLKTATPRQVVEITRSIIARVDVPVIVNDRADIALAAGAAGVHVGKADLPAVAVRRFAPPGFIIGASLGSDAEVPNAKDADYVGIGPVFGSDSKTDAGTAIGVDGFKKLAALVQHPAVAV